MLLQEQKSALFEAGPISQKKDLQKRGVKEECVHFANLGYDTICFHHTCRQTHTQVLCSYCDQLLCLHQSHPQDLSPIYRTSPGFRLIDRPTSPTSARILAIHIEEFKKAIVAIQTELLSYIEQIVSQPLKRLQCYKDFLSQNAFDVCNKICKENEQHQNCCIPIINDLKDLEDKGSVSEKSVEQIILGKAQWEKSNINRQFRHIRKEMEKLLTNQQKQPHINIKVSMDGSISQAKSLKQRIDNDIEYREQGEDQSLNERIRIFESNNMYFKEPHEHFESTTSRNALDTIKEEVSQADYYSPFFAQSQRYPFDCKQQAQRFQRRTDNLINEEMNPSKSILKTEFSSYSKCLEQRQSLQLKEQSTVPAIQRKSFRLLKFKGIELINGDTARIWKKDTIVNTPKAIYYLSTLTQVKHIIIETQAIATPYRLDQILRHMSWLQGIHIHCQYRLQKAHLNIYPIRQVSLVPNYHYLRIIDKAKYFSSAIKENNVQRRRDKMKILQEKPFFNKLYIYRKRHPTIPPSIQELQFCGFEESRLLLYEDIFAIESPNRLAVLYFSNAFFNASATFKQVFTKCSLLHTLAFENCEANYNKIMKQFTFLVPLQLKQLQVSCIGFDKKVVLDPTAIAEIFRLRSLETLILTNIEFADPMSKEEADGSMLKDIANLRELIHLNLYASSPVGNDLLTHLSSQCCERMELINLGCTAITHGVGKCLQRFTNLKSLCVDYTSVGDEQLLLATKYMSQLTYLSIQNLNGEPVKWGLKQSSDCSNRYGKVTPYLFCSMKHKSLQYVNIYNCYQIKEYWWKQFRNVECIRINKEIVSPKLYDIFRRKAVFLPLKLCNDLEISSSKQSLPLKSTICYDKVKISQDREEVENRALNSHVFQQAKPL